MPFIFDTMLTNKMTLSSFADLPIDKNQSIKIVRKGRFGNDTMFQGRFTNIPGKLKTKHNLIVTTIKASDDVIIAYISPNQM